MRFVRPTWAAAAALCLLLGAALRFVFLHHPPPLSGDTLIYGQIATNWMHSGLYGFSLSGGTPHATLIRLPGYPLFLVLCFRLFGTGNYAAVLRIQAAADLGTCTLVALTALRLFGRRSALLALLLGCLCPFTSNYVAAPLTETLTLFSISLAFYALVRWLEHGAVSRWLWILSAALAYALLLRPEQALLAASILPILWWRSRSTPTISPIPRNLPALVALTILILPLFPWTIRNYRTFHVFQPLAPHYATDPGEMVPLGFQRWFRSWAVDFASTEDVYWNFDGAPIRLDDLPSRAFDTPAQRAETASLLADYNQDTDASPAVDARFEAIARQRIAAHPLRYFVELPAARLVNMLLRPRTELMETTLDWWNRSEYPRDFRFALSLATLNAGYLLLGLAGLIRSRSATGATRLVLASTLAFVLLRSALLLTLDNSEPRYTLEFFPILCLWASALAARPRTSPSV